MRAVEMSEFGPPQVLVPVEMLDPVAGTGQVVVAVAFASITFVETQVRAGKAPNPAMMPVLPVVPGNGVGGVVIQVGEGVSPALLGARVVTSTGGSGGYAERVAVPGAGLIPVPDDLRLDDAVALLADGRTAGLLMRAATVRSGDVVLVEAAAGGVGSLLIQLARNAGARVVAAAGTPQKLELARELGADFAVNYREPHWADRVRAEVPAVNVVFDGVGGAIGRTAFTLLSPSGRFSAYGMASGSFANISQGDADQRGVAVIRGGPLTPEQMLELARFALGEAAAGRLRPVIGQRFPLERAADAHAAIAARSVIGKTLLVITPTPFTPTERDYLATQTLGRLATVQPDGTLQVSPVGFQYNGGTATIDIRGYTMAASRKFHNVARNGRVAFVVDDIASRQPWRVRCLEIRGHAEAIDAPSDAVGELDGAIIRIHPERIISFGIDDPDHEPHQLIPNIRNVAEPPAHRGRN